MPDLSELYLFSDGVFEICRPDNTWQSWEELAQFMQSTHPSIEMIVSRMRELRGAKEFDDDFSLLKVKMA